ncbi:MAG: RNA methyltransferase [Bacteroidetes bacterium]|nr:RNA methyltransferase [Bacteroidota bacterium]MBC35244.1 RNA methyltransferase [Bacteroidota bacterium]
MRKISNNELNRLSIQEFKETQKIPVKVVLDDIRSLNNIGSVFRTADAFLIQEIHLCGITAKPPHREIQKTALGATESVEWKYFKSIEDSIAELKKEGFKIYAVEQVENSISLENFSMNNNENIAVIFGNEVAGVNQNILKSVDGGIEIPQMGTKHSLNISVCAGIVLWHLFKSKNL